MYAKGDSRSRTRRRSATSVGDVTGAKQQGRGRPRLHLRRTRNRIGHVTPTRARRTTRRGLRLRGCDTKNRPTSALPLHVSGRMSERTTDLGGLRRTRATTIPPELHHYIPKLTCCAPYADPSARSKPYRAAPADGILVPRLRSPNSTCARRQLGAVPFTVRPAPTGPTTRSTRARRRRSPRPPFDLVQDTTYWCKTGAGESRGQRNEEADDRRARSSSTGARRQQRGQDGAKYVGQGASILTGTFADEQHDALRESTGRRQRLRHRDAPWDPNDGAVHLRRRRARVPTPQSAGRRHRQSNGIDQEQRSSRAASSANRTSSTRHDRSCRGR